MSVEALRSTNHEKNWKSKCSITNHRKINYLIFDFLIVCDEKAGKVMNVRSLSVYICYALCLVLLLYGFGFRIW